MPSARAVPSDHASAPPAGPRPPGRARSDVHARRARSVLCVGKLLVAHPLQPRVELDSRRQLAPLRLHPVAVRRTGLRRPSRVVGRQFLGEHAPGREVPQPVPLDAAELLERVLPARAALDPEDPFEHPEFRPVRRVAVDPVGPVVRPLESRCGVAHPRMASRREVRRLRDILDADVQRVDVAAGGRQVRRRSIGGRGCAACSGLTRT